MRGVDFTGCNFFGVNIYELDLSECIISPAQIEQAIGHKPTPEELRKILAPKRKKVKYKMKGIDFTALFDSRGGFDWDTTKGGVSMETMLKASKEFIKSFHNGDKKEDKDKEKEEPKESSVDDLRKSIEENKKKFLEEKQEQRSREDGEKTRNLEEQREKIKETRAAMLKARGNER